MAVLFGLAVNFGDDQVAAQRARQLVLTSQPVDVVGRSIALHPPSLYDAISAAGTRYIEFWAIPVGVGWNYPPDWEVGRVALDRTELSALGRGLYAVLSRMDGYRAAQVGWDPERLVDPAELRAGWSDDLARGDLPGLVLSTRIRRSLHPTTGFQPFGEDHEWIPYQGERAGNQA